MNVYHVRPNMYNKAICSVVFPNIKVEITQLWEFLRITYCLISPLITLQESERLYLLPSILYFL